MASLDGSKSDRARAYEIWSGMMKRCLNERNQAYAAYGGRGISVCVRWRLFDHFHEDMGNPPRAMTLDRKDNDGEYSKGNCRWASRKEQARNRRSSVFYFFNGERTTLPELSERHGIPTERIRTRIKRLGWSVERAATVPIREGNWPYAKS